jgi:S-adenosylmethionine/arginine decarboxylase-like enzyme
MHLQLTTVPVRKRALNSDRGQSGGTVGISKGNETKPGAVLSAQPGDAPGPAAPTLAGGMGALAVARRVPNGRTYLPWGMLAAIDLHGCERSRLEDPETLRRFVPSLINAIGMRAHGPLVLDRFGDGELEGWSAMQFIETSSITVHSDEVRGRCFVDVFSCRPFDSDAAAAVAVAHFGGTFRLRVLHR